MDKETMKTALQERENAYYSLSNDLFYMEDKLRSLKKHRGHSPAFKGLLISLELMRAQVDQDFYRYKSRIGQRSYHYEMSSLQKSLNRERLKRENLEKKVNEAKVSSGLFISYVREKLGF